MGGVIPPLPSEPSWQNRNNFAYTLSDIRPHKIYSYINTVGSSTAHVEFPASIYFEK
jgi:hypothetical protein